MHAVHEVTGRRATAALALTLTLSLACGPAEGPPVSAAAEVAPATTTPMSGLEVPPRVHDDGSPDSCPLLTAAAPQTLLGVELGPAFRIYGLCRFEERAAPAGAPERSVGLEIRRDAPGVAANQDEFWEREGAGVGMAGGTREGIQELAEPGDYALWHPIEGGLRVFAYWDREYVLVLTVKGAPQERALPWALELARASVRAARS